MRNLIDTIFDTKTNVLQDFHICIIATETSISERKLAALSATETKSLLGFLSLR